jgi:hypothetical protein
MMTCTGWVLIPGSDFEAVDESSLKVNVNSGQAAGSIPIVSTPPSTHAPKATATGTHSPTSAMTPEIAELINRSSMFITTGNNIIHTPGSGGSNTMLSVMLGSVVVVVLLIIIIAGSRFILVRKFRR